MNLEKQHESKGENTIKYVEYVAPSIGRPENVS